MAQNLMTALIIFTFVRFFLTDSNLKKSRKKNGEGMNQEAGILKLTDLTTFNPCIVNCKKI